MYVIDLMLIAKVPIIRKRLLQHLSLQAEHFSILVSGIRILRMTLHHRAKIISHGVK